MIPTVAFVFLLIGLALAMFGPVLDAATTSSPRKRRRRKKSSRHAAASTQTMPLTVVPKDREHG